MLPEPTTRSCVTLTRRQHRALRGLAATTGAWAAELTRRALDDYLVGRVAGYVPGPLRPQPEADPVGSAPSTTRS